MAVIVNIKKQNQAFWSEKIKAHGVKSGQVHIAPGENIVPDDVYSEIKSSPFFKGMVDSGEFIVKQDKAVLKAAQDEAASKAKALKESEALKAKIEADKVKALKKQLKDLGVDGRTLTGLTSKELEVKLDEATAPKA